MAAFSPSTHKVIVSPTGNLKDGLPLDARVLLSRLFSDMGIFQIAIGNTAPADKDVLWYHTDVKQFKRYDGVLGNWFPLVANQTAMHVMRRALLGSVQETGLETGDLFYFWDASAADLKKITKDDLSANILKDVFTSLNGQRIFIDTSSGPQSVSLPAAPSDGDRRRFYDRKGTFSGSNAATVNRNGKTIALSATNLILDLQHIGVELSYSAALGDWQITEFFRSNVL